MRKASRPQLGDCSACTAASRHACGSRGETGFRSDPSVDRYRPGRADPCWVDRSADWIGHACRLPFSGLSGPLASATSRRMAYYCAALEAVVGCSVSYAKMMADVIFTSLTA